MAVSFEILNNLQVQGVLTVSSISSSGLIATSNSIGIGTANPASKLHIYENTSVLGTQHGVTIEQDGAGYSILQFLITGGQRWSVGVAASDENTFKIATGALVSDKFRLDSNGNGLFIGNLSVRGNTIVSGGEIIVLDATNRKISIRGSSFGNWDNAFGFTTSGFSPTFLGGFGIYGTNANLNYYYIGEAYNSNFAEFSSTGVTLKATTASTSHLTGALKLSGGLGVAGAINSNNSISGTAINISGANQTYRSVKLKTGSNDRWALGANNDDELGFSNFGSNFTLDRYADNGTYVGTVFKAFRNNGSCAFFGNVFIETATSIGNVFSIKNSNTANIASATISVENNNTGLDLITWSNTYTGRENQSWITTRGNNSLKLGAGSSAWLTIEPVTGNIKISSTTFSTSFSTGALVISGGLAVGERTSSPVVYCEDFTSTNFADVHDLGADTALAGRLYIGGQNEKAEFRYFAGTDTPFKGLTLYTNLGYDYPEPVDETINTWGLNIGGSDSVKIVKWAPSIPVYENTYSTLFQISNIGVVSIPATVASITTTTGALVVSGGVGIAGSLNVGGSVLNLTNVNTGQTVLTVTNTSNGATAGASLGTSNGTSELKVTTWSSTYAGRASQSWIYTTTSQSLKLGTNNTSWLSILSSGVVQVLSDVDGTSSTGALMIEGGMFVGKSIYCLENITCVSNLNSGNISSNGDLSVLGSATIGGDINFIDSTGPSVLGTLSSKSPRQGLVFDGTAGVTVTSVSAFRVNSFTVAIWVNPTAIGSTQYLFSGASGAFSLVLLSDGRIQSGKMGGSNNTASIGTIAAGKNTLIIYIRNGNVATYYINGVYAGHMTDAQDYTAAVSVIGKHGSASQDYFTGRIFGNIIYNRNLSTAERKALYETGVPEAADYNNAGATLNTTNFTDVGGGSTLSGNSSAGVTVVRASGSSYIAVRNGGISARPGQRFRISGTLTLNAGKTVVPVAYVDGTSSAQVSLAAGAFSIEIVTPASGGTVNGIIISGNGDQNWTLSNFSAISLGVVLAPDATQSGGGSTWYDTSGKYADITIPATGVKWNVVSSEKVNALETSGILTSNGNFYCYNNGYFEGNLNVQADITVVAGVKSQSEIQTESHFNLFDGIPSAPSLVTGFASIYIDGADGDLKIRFSDGTIKTIVTDT